MCVPSSLTSLEDLVSAGSALPVAPAHLVDLLGGVSPGLQGEGQGTTVVNPAVVPRTTEPRMRGIRNSKDTALKYQNMVYIHDVENI